MANVSGNGFDTASGDVELIALAVRVLRQRIPVHPPVADGHWHNYAPQNEHHIEVAEAADERYEFLGASQLDDLVLVAFRWRGVRHLLTVLVSGDPSLTDYRVATSLRRLIEGIEAGTASVTQLRGWRVAISDDIWR